MCRRAVREWLVLLTMEIYIGRFLERGYDSIAHCKLIVVSDLIMLGVDNATHRKLLLDGVQFLINAPEKFICMEPCELHCHLEPELDSVIESASFKSFDSFNFIKSPDKAELDPIMSSISSLKAINWSFNEEYNKLMAEEFAGSPSNRSTCKKVETETEAFDT
ncbi:uncharacterized protein LOC108115600 [Drosophila eugracilis]|uniref:uncharacterized protein LOC108115600 n=1 Tax=Drosophila eugracilis TaxID=29029 RepID=UPI0007E708A3|nr:uncharacterized protein LOC108115600 [Drosophila eugracilis]